MISSFRNIIIFARHGVMLVLFRLQTDFSVCSPLDNPEMNYFFLLTCCGSSSSVENVPIFVQCFICISISNCTSMGFRVQTWSVQALKMDQVVEDKKQQQKLTTSIIHNIVRTDPSLTSREIADTISLSAT